MSVADEKYKELILDIYKNGSWDNDGNVRTVYADGTPAYTKSLFGRQVVFEEGEIPLLTGKYVGWKTAFKELYTFWILQSVKKEDFHNQNIHVWDEWFKSDNTLGRSYAYQFESHRNHNRDIIKVKSKLKNNIITSNNLVTPKLENPNEYCTDAICGNTFQSASGELIVLDVFKSGTHYDNTKSVKIQFIETGYTTICRKNDATIGSVKDNYSRTVLDVGYLGNFENVNNYSEKQIKILKCKWSRMLTRCYDIKDDHYKNYGGNGVFVDEKFLSFENFLIEIRNLPQFFLAKENDFKGWSIDKDYYGSNCYSPDTCVWLSEKENKLYRDFIKPINIVFKNGTSKILLSIPEVVNEIGTSTSTIHRWLNGDNDSYKKYGIELINYIEDDEFLYRYELSKNQVVDLINNVNDNPMSRRLMTSFWNDADVYKKALQECAMQTTWNVRDGKLDLLLYSRSVDSPLGLPFNWIQYWFLLQMVSKVTGYKPGKFIHQMGNVHYYDRHEDIILEQIESPTFKQPEFKINDEINSFFDFTLDDISIENYEHGGKFKYEVAI